MGTTRFMFIEDRLGNAGSVARPTMYPTHLFVESVGEILIREVLPEDKWRFKEGITNLSPESRNFRFHNPRFELSDSQIDYLVQTDQINHVAIGAVDCSKTSLPGIAVARWVRDEDRPERAEVALTVIDRYQGRGIGTLLFAVLCLYAQRDGIEKFDFFIHAHRNTLIARYMNLNARISGCYAGVLDMEMEVPTKSSDLPGTSSGKYLRQAMELFQRSF